MLQSVLTHWNLRNMDHYRIPSKKKNQYLLHPHVFIKRTFQFVLPVSLASILISYTCSSFSYFSLYHFKTLVFPFFTHVFERKYMFLICNGILAFLMKTLNFSNDNKSSSSYSLSDLDDDLIDSSLIAPRVGGYSENFEQDSAGEEEEEEEEEEIRHAAHQVEEDAVYEDPVENDREGDFIVESEGFDMESEVVIDDEEENMEDEYSLGGGALMGDDQRDQTEVMNMNTEELNQKFEEFIRKMKEELRIQQQQYHLIAV